MKNMEKVNPCVLVLLVTILAIATVCGGRRVARKDLGLDIGGDMGAGMGMGIDIGIGIGGGGSRSYSSSESGSSASSSSNSRSSSSSSSSAGLGGDAGPESGSSTGSYATPRSGSGSTGSGSENRDLQQDLVLDQTPTTGEIIVLSSVACKVYVEDN
ncbi:uncharacterized protein LOC142530194 [Primulina tabacum]|uniref:uncharacterized protein LOC142530194 n=1 Tax=Primulina tabacum TaxID=48773 RepID=UPI003F598E87